MIPGCKFSKGDRVYAPNPSSDIELPERGIVSKIRDLGYPEFPILVTVKIDNSDNHLRVDYHPEELEWEKK